MTVRILFIGEAGDFPRKFTEPSTLLDETSFDSGTPSLEYCLYEHLGTHKVIEKAIDAERHGYDAIVIGCFYDTGMSEARELVAIPVVGICEASLHMASMVTAEKFSILVGRRKWIPRLADNARRYGLESKIASWRIVHLGLKDMEDSDRTRDIVIKEARNAVNNDLAEAVVLGCTEMVGLAEIVQQKLRVPVIDPVLMGVKFAELRAYLWKRFGISHSKIGGYEKPPKDELELIYKNNFGNR